MFFGYKFHALFTLFALNSIQLRDATETITETENVTETGTVRPNKTRHGMDDLSTFTMDTYCKLQANQYVCGVTTTVLRYYFDVQLHQCVRFEYGNCSHTYNLFHGRHECLSSCSDAAYSRAFTNITENVYCRYQPDFGECNSYYPMWYFDITEMRCKGFSYSGCGGNYNRFHSATDCLIVCGNAVKHYEHD